MTHSTLRTALAALGLIAAALTACSAGSVQPAPTLYEVSLLRPTATPTMRLTPTITPTPSRTPASTPSPTPEATEDSPCIPDADFDGDVTILDGTTIGAGQPFTKVWRLRNSGACDWNSSYTLVFAWGDALSRAREISLPAAPAGETVDVSVEMQAPEANGEYVSGWRLVAPDGEAFGIEIYVSIRVVDAASPTPRPTGVPTATAGPPTSTPLPSGYPNISGVTDHARELFVAGKQPGNRPNVFSKVGDSITVEWPFLGQIGEGYYHLADHAHLQPVIAYFSAETARTRNSFAETSLAAWGGWPSWAPLEDWRADPICGGVIPLTCEYSRVRPSVALIMLGTNDAILKSPADVFEYYLQQIVQKTVDAGIIPVLYTIPWCLCGDVTPYNDAVVRTARAFDVPLVDYYTAMEQGLNHGIRDDGIHPSSPPDGFASNFDAEHLKYGYNIRNLMTLQVLDLLWRQVLSK